MISTRNTPPRLIIGISSASGTVFGIKALQLLQTTAVETHLVISKATAMTAATETDMKMEDIRSLADIAYPIGDVGAAIASGSFKTMGMLIAPCSVKTMGEISSGVTSNLLSRAADVVLKERRRLVLMLRETPLHTGHLENALRITNMGGIIAPPVPAFYTTPKSLDDMVTQTVCRCLDLFDIESAALKRWGDSTQVDSGG